MAATVRVVSSSPNTPLLVGFPGISATLPRLEGRVEIRPKDGVAAPCQVTLVTIKLERKETIHPAAESMAKKHLAAPRKETRDHVGREMLLYRCPVGKDHDKLWAMDLPFVIFIPFGRGGEEIERRIPPASLVLPSRTAETSYEIVVTIRHGNAESYHVFPVPITRYDTLSTFGMYNRPESAEKTSDHLVTLGVSLPRWSYGPLDPVSVFIKLSPNPDWLNKARRVTISKITLGIDEEVIYNHEGDEPTRKVKTIASKVERVNLKMPDQGYFSTLGLVFPSKDSRDSSGILPRPNQSFPSYNVASFSTAGRLYKIEFYLTVKATLTSAKDILLRHPIIVCPLDHTACKAEMEAIEQAAKDAAYINPENPMLPAPMIWKAGDPKAINALGVVEFRANRPGKGEIEIPRRKLLID